MIITPAALQALMTTHSKSYQDGLGMADSQYAKLATVIKSTSKQNDYGWLGQWPGFREWIGDRTVKDMEAHGYAIVNKHFESTVGVSRDDIEDDNLGLYAPMFQEMGRATTAFRDELVFPLLGDGFTSTCYDGQYFFDTDHPVNAEVDGSGADTSTSNVIVDGGYVGDPWFLLDTSRSLKPFIFQNRKDPKFTSMTKEDDEQVFTANEFRYGVDLRCNVGYGFWQMAVGVKHTLNAANLQAGFEAMRGFTADGGRPLGLKPNVLVVPKSLEFAAYDLIDKEKTGGGDSNIWYKRLEIVVADWI
jgi:phage major head subunit gpT-like protein